MDNKYCYNFIQYNYNDGLLNNAIDATYIIHLKNNGREKQIENQLNEFHPSNTLYLVENKGYKNCKKKLPKQNASYDLVDNYLHIFHHANDNNYSNILILEDDFIFNKKLKDNLICDDICSFINTKTKNKETFIYYLGCIPYLKYNILDKNENLLGSTGTHSVIYSKKFRNYILSSDTKKINDWDLNILYNFFYINKYCYHVPLCYQIFPETENQRCWPEFFGLKTIMLFIFKSLKLDTQYEPGFSIMYSFANLLTFLLVIIIIYILLKVLSKR